MFVDKSVSDNDVEWTQDKEIQDAEENSVETTDTRFPKPPKRKIDEKDDRVQKVKILKSVFLSCVCCFAFEPHRRENKESRLFYLTPFGFRSNSHPPIKLNKYGINKNAIVDLRSILVFAE
ncbi:hypothetical protein DPMN_113121 [Dreissena polymorpha]|uniref:Uncharacterized protein n=1 Tax=Dreissena polymorpha TaxID=45954 RepID=A0A9D4KHP5_DREPO|nr:hypothetical protein DPMN_113121 [Dreissena polymorpha]